MQTLDISHNTELTTVPSEVGWLPLTRLDIDGNSKLRMPKIVIERGFRCEIPYPHPTRTLSVKM